jgi:tetratricopeptide (TPR) repeat protein
MKNLEDKLAQLEAAEDHFSAIETLDLLVMSDPDNLDYRFKLGLKCLKVGKVERAESLLKSCEESGFDDPKLDLNLGHTMKALGRSEDAVAYYKRLVRSRDDVHAAIAYWSLANLKDYRFDDAEVGFLVGRVQITEAKPGYRGLMLFALACAREQQSRYEQAFMAMSEANLILAQHRPFRADLYGEFVSSLIKEVVTPAAPWEQQGPRPIFVVGMPRSGTTLVEQILASHSSVESTDELLYLGRIGLELEQSGGYAKALAAFDNKQQQNLASQYLEKVKQYRQQGLEYFIDKNPANFLHIGLIKSLFPNARIINVVRDSLDNAMGVFKQYFHQGNEFSYSMKGIIYYWQGYLTLMRHWEQLYPGEILHLSYEALANNPEEKITEIVEYCGLPMEPQCFRFYESDRPVLTPSASQVRNPISARSVGSGLKYEKYIKPVIPALAEIKRKSREVLGI